MERNEYAAMRAVEDRHWWYRGLRAVVREALAQYGATAMRILDAGCGTGANLALLAGDHQPLGVDFAHEAVAFCRERAFRQTARASVAALPFGDDAFDAVLSCDVLCHKSLPDKPAAFAELARVVRPGGLVLINLPAYRWLHSSHDIHVHTDARFTAPQVRALLDAAGCAPLRVTYWNTALFPPLAAIRLLRKVWPPQGSDLEAGAAPWAAPLLGPLLEAEAKLALTATLPYGMSVFAVGKKG